MPDLFTSLTLGLHLVTYHFGGVGLEDNTPGIYVQAHGGMLDGGIAGSFRNSYGARSDYVGYAFETADKRFSLVIGAVTGYPAAKVMPLVVPGIKFSRVFADVDARIEYLPKPRKGGTTDGLHFTVERSF